MSNVPNAPFFVESEDDTTGEITKYYESQERQTVFHRAVDDALNGTGPTCLLYGGAAYGGKTEALVWTIFSIATDPKWKNLKIGVFRKTYPEIEKYFIMRALEGYPKGYATYRQKDHSLTFHETGATVWFNFCENDVDVLKYQGAGFDVLVFDEITHHTEYVFKYLRTRNRTSVKGFRRLLLASTNPGGVGHQWVKRLWIDKNEYTDDERVVYERDAESVYRERVRSQEETARDYLFIPAKIWDNKIGIDNDPTYVQSLRQLPEMDRRALLEGDWDIFAGQYFRELRRDVHAFDPVKFGPIPDGWVRFIALDYGFYPHPASVGWYAVDESGWLYRYKELLCQRYTTSELAKRILQLTSAREIARMEYVIAPPDIWAVRGNAQGKSGAEEMQEVFDTVKLLVLKADNDRLNGWRQMREYLKTFEYNGGRTAQFHVASTCQMFWKQIPQVQHDPKRPEDVLKVGVADGQPLWAGDDVADEVRYAIMSRFPKSKLQDKKDTKDRYGQPVRKGLSSGFRRSMVQIPKPGKYRGHDKRA